MSRDQGEEEVGIRARIRRNREGRRDCCECQKRRPGRAGGGADRASRPEERRKGKTTGIEKWWRGQRRE
uniref:Uncharacterized protein n=1 Tax=Arundo donax TaxID=35708 RepID=A0A0A9H6W6_ARUDO